MTDTQLQTNVQDALAWEPSIDSADIGVSVGAGVVTLRGDVKTYFEKSTAERVALGVYGVRAVANDLSVHIPNIFQRTDTEIAQAAVSALRWSSAIPADSIEVTVSDGWVSLQGHVPWNYQRAIAETAVRDLKGVRGVTNGITVEPRVKASDVSANIEAALKRSAEVDARHVRVAVSDGKVTLSGNVRTWLERDEARQAAWAAPGVREVENRIAIMP
jgi:osmotically-inducible protein OsmY